MESIIRNVRDIDSADREALEHVVGSALRENQQLIIQVVSIDLSDPTAQKSGDGIWSDELQARRSELIDKYIAGTASVEERAAMIELDRRANEHFDTVAPPPIEGARRLHQQLLKNRAN